MIPQWWSWALALTGCLGFWLVGSGKKWGWGVNIGVQVLWITYAVVTQQWGFVLGSIFYGAVFARNLRIAYKDKEAYELALERDRESNKAEGADSSVGENASN